MTNQKSLSVNIWLLILQRNNTKNDREFRKRFMKYARVEDDADLVQTSEEDGDDNLSSEVIFAQLKN